MNLLESGLSSFVSNTIIFVFEIISLVIAVSMIIVGIIQNKTSQTGLSALNGGNEELFANSKERGIDKVMSVWMLSLGISLSIVAIVIGILQNTIV
jgi:preprotein translocase subunit SecG